MTRALRNLVAALVFCLAVVFALGMLPGFVERHYRIPMPELHAMILLMQCVCLVLFSMVLAVRLVSRHPIGHSHYLAWLMTTPWQVGLPLPLGEVRPALADVGALIVISACMKMYLGLPATIPWIAFALAFSIASLGTLLRAGSKWPAFATWMLLFTLPRLYPQMQAIMAVTIAAYIIAQLAIVQSLRRYPWGYDTQEFPKVMPGGVFQLLSPATPEPDVSSRDALVVAAGLGWAAYSILWFFNEAKKVPFSDAGPMPIVAIVFCLGAILRWGIYCGSYWPPISLWGRVRTGRLILRGYDHVFVAPLLTVMAVTALPWWLLKCGTGHPITAGVTIPIAIVILWLCPPSLTKWRLTGSHRILLPELRRSTKPVKRLAAA